MGKKYDIGQRLRDRNIKSVVEIDKDHKFIINTTKTNVLCIMALIKKDDKKDDDPESSIKLIDDIIRLALGREALEYINSQDMTMAAINDIVTVIMASINEKDANFDEDEKPEKK